jgi:hypothetical protein
MRGYSSIFLHIPFTSCTKFWTRLRPRLLVRANGLYSCRHHEHWPQARELTAAIGQNDVQNFTRTQRLRVISRVQGVGPLQGRAGIGEKPVPLHFPCAGQFEREAVRMHGTGTKHLKTTLLRQTHPVLALCTRNHRVQAAEPVFWARVSAADATELRTPEKPSCLAQQAVSCPKKMQQHIADPCSESKITHLKGR